MDMRREITEMNDFSGSKVRARTARDTVINKLDLSFIGTDAIFKTTLEGMLKEYRTEMENLKQMVAVSDPGSIVIRKRDDNVFFAVYDRGKEKGISRDMNTIYGLARRKFADVRIKELKEIIKEIERNIRRISKEYERSSLETTANRFAYSGLDLLKIVFSKKQNEWIDESYTPNPYHQEHLIHKTKSGILVRSHGELAIANAFEQIGIPYRSDDIVQIQDKKTGKTRTFFADFKAPNFRGGISILEHLGGFGFKGYSENAMERLNAYSDSSEINNNEVFWSFDSTVNNPEDLKKLIFNLLMPL